MCERDPGAMPGSVAATMQLLRRNSRPGRLASANFRQPAVRVFRQPILDVLQRLLQPGSIGTGFAVQHGDFLAVVDQRTDR